MAHNAWSGKVHVLRLEPVATLGAVVAQGDIALGSRDAPSMMIQDVTIVKGAGGALTVEMPKHRMGLSWRPSVQILSDSLTTAVTEALLEAWSTAEQTRTVKKPG